MDPFNATQMLQYRNRYQQVNPNNQYSRNDMPVLRDCINNLGDIYNQKQVCVKRILNGEWEPKARTLVIFVDL